MNCNECGQKIDVGDFYMEVKVRGAGVNAFDAEKRIHVRCITMTQGRPLRRHQK